eukprot:7693071-Prorocentrum_lima.AAC.1
MSGPAATSLPVLHPRAGGLPPCLYRSPLSRQRECHRLYHQKALSLLRGPVALPDVAWVVALETRCPWTRQPPPCRQPRYVWAPPARGRVQSTPVRGESNGVPQDEGRP